MPKISGINHAEIRATMQKTHIPGVSIAYQHGQKPLETTCIGKTDKHHVKAESTVKKHTTFGAASLSKPVFAYLVLKLVEKGIFSRAGETPESGLDRPMHELLSLDSFFHTYNKALSTHDTLKAQAITPRMLLSHSSGLGIDNSPILSFDPGSEYAYSGLGLMYLQQVIEQQTGQSLEQLAKAEVFEPLHMTHSSFIPPEMPHYMMHTISSEKKSAAIAQQPNAANSLHTTATDYTKLMQAWMQDPSPVMQEAFRPQIILTEDKQKLPGQSEPAARHVPEEDKAHLAWGLGLGLELDDNHVATKAFHTGDMNQYRAQMALDLRAQSSIVYFANGRNHKEANGHVLGPLVIMPKIPIPHAHHWFYGKFPFAKKPEELIGGPHFGLRRSDPHLSPDSTTRILSEISAHPLKKNASKHQSPPNTIESNSDKVTIASHDTPKEGDAIQNDATPTPLSITPQK